MNSKEQKFIKSWEIAINLGRFKYALIYSVFFSLFTYLISSLITYYVFADKTTYQTNRIITYLITFLIGGFVLFYFYTWKTNNKKYNSLLNK